MVHYGEIRVVGTSDSTPEHVRTAVNLLAENKLPADKIPSHIIPMEDFTKAFDLMTSGEALRVILKP